MTGLVRLPTEILVEILSYLDVTDISNCVRTCHLLDNVIGESIKLRYLTQLEVAGMQDNPFCTLSIADRLTALEERESSWRSVNWKFITSIEVPSRWSGVYDVTPSVYLLGKSSADFEYVTAGIQSIKLPSQIPDPQDAGSVEWTEFNFGMHIIDFGTAIEEHDLLACVCSVCDEVNPDVFHIVVVLLQYSTKKMHNACRSSVIHLCRSEISQGLPNVSIEVVGENLAVVVVFNRDAGTGYDSLHVYNWKSGQSKTNPLPVNNTGVTFLRHDLLLNPNIIRKSLDVYYIPSSSSPSSKPTASVRLIHSFFLPALKIGQRFTHVSCRSDPNPTSGGTFPKHSRCNRPFANDPDCAIIIFTFKTRSFTGVGSRDFVMITHRKSFLKLLPPFVLPAVSTKTFTRQNENVFFRSHSMTVTSWNSWGPPNTRWFNADDFPTMFITTTSGQRCVQFVPSIRGIVAHPLDRPDTILVLDFNPWHVKLAKHVGHVFNPDDVFGLVGEVPTTAVDTDTQEPQENICLAHGVFAENIVGRLPYLVCQAHQKWGYHTVLMDEERLLGIKANIHFRSTLQLSNLQSNIEPRRTSPPGIC